MRLNPFKAHRQQHLMVITEDKRILPTSLPVEKGFCCDDGTMEAWQTSTGTLLRRGQTSIMDIIVFERDASPLIFNGAVSTNRKSLKENAKVIGEEYMNKELFLITKNTLKNKFMELVQIIIIVFGIILAITVIFGLIDLGKLHLPF